MVPAANDVNKAYDRFSGLVGDYRDAIKGVVGVTFSSVSSSVQTGWVGMVMSLYNTTTSGAEAIAKTETLQSAVELAASLHSAYLYNYDDVYDKHGRVTQDSVRVQILEEIVQHGGIDVSASTMLEAYWKYYHIVEDYNVSVDAWNRYAPSQKRNKRFTTFPSKVKFSKFRCFGGCNYEYDMLDYARDGHEESCGSAQTVEEALGWSYWIRKAQPDLYLAAKENELARRTIEDGCGLSYYVCNLDDREAHHEQTCSTSGCSVKYRNCLPHTKDHKNHGTTTASTPSTPTTPTPAPTTVTYTCGIHSGVAGSESSDHSTTISGYSGSFYECQPHQTFGCSHTDLTSNFSSHVPADCNISGHYGCDSSSHVQEQCTVTNSNSDRCTYMFWRCVHPNVPSYGPSHIHSYPAAPVILCWRNDCPVEVNDAADHKSFCGSGNHAYWPRCPDLSSQWWHNDSTHTLKPCSRCGVQFRPCSNTNTCTNGWKHSG